MQLNFLGHACLLVEAEDTRIVFDPLLRGVHHEGLYDVYPACSLDLDRMPRYDAVVVSHTHLDHFDPWSLSRIPRQVPLFVAADPILVACVHALGFTAVRTLEDFTEYRIGSLSIRATPSRAGLVEHGFIVWDDTATVWNLVDTLPSADAIDMVRRLHPDITLAITPWQPLQDGDVVRGRPSASFPFEAYDALIDMTRRTGARAIVPGACGFHATEIASWTNHMLFPVARERFVDDVATAIPHLRGAVHVVDPGDQITVERGGVDVARDALDYCQRRHAYEWQDLAFRPHLVGLPVVEHEGAAFRQDEVLPAVRAFFEDSIPSFVREHRERFARHFEWGACMQMDVVFHDGIVSWVQDFTGCDVTVVPRVSPHALSHAAISASVLMRLVAGTTSWEFVALSGAYRHQDHTYRFVDGVLKRGPGLDAPVEIMLGTRATLARMLVSTLRKIIDDPSAA